MASKAERTAQFIIETVAPVFNKFGYIGTSMSALTKATGLTKGAIYGNFKNKEQLAIAAFNYNVRRLFNAIKNKTDQEKSPYAKLKAIVNFYREYHDFTIPFGGCPILNVGIDACFSHPKLIERVKEVVHKIQARIIAVIEAGVETGEFKKDVNAKLFARKVFSLFEGGVFMTMTMNDSQYLLDITDQVDLMIEQELRQKAA